MQKPDRHLYTFFADLQRMPNTVKHAYSFRLDKQGRVVGTFNGNVIGPLQALLQYETGSGADIDDYAAADRLQMRSEIADYVVLSANNDYCNRNFVPEYRADLLKILKLSRQA